jgi:hypothetical protein
MTDTQRDQIRRLLEKQSAASSASPAAARESLMRSGLYNDDGTLKVAYGGKKKSMGR